MADEMVTTVFCDERSRAIWEGTRARVSSGPTGGPTAVNTPAEAEPDGLVPCGSIVPAFGWPLDAPTYQEEIKPALAQQRDEAQRLDAATVTLAAGAGERLAKQEARQEAIVGFIVSHFEITRGMSAEQAAKMIGIDVRTLQRWRHDAGALEPALRRRPTPFLERLVCLLAPMPVAPALPSSMVLRSSPPQLELRAPHAALAQLDAWAQLVAPCQVTRNNARMFVRADLATLRRLRSDLMHLERWQTCTPLAADVDVWIGIGGGE